MSVSACDRLAHTILELLVVAYCDDVSVPQAHCAAHSYAVNESAKGASLILNVDAVLIACNLHMAPRDAAIVQLHLARFTPADGQRSCWRDMDHQARRTASPAYEVRAIELR